MKNNATKVGCPYLIWKEYVRAELGLSDADIKPFVPRLSAAYNMGEPVWMMVDELKHRIKYTKIATQADKDSPDNLKKVGMWPRREGLVQEMVEQVLQGTSPAEVLRLSEAQLSLGHR